MYESCSESTSSVHTLFSITVASLNVRTRDKGCICIHYTVDTPIFMLLFGKTPHNYDITIEQT